MAVKAVPWSTAPSTSARQDRSDGTTTYYAGPMEVEISNGASRVKTYWPMGLGVEIDQPSGATELNWTHLDRLGSVVAISDAAGVLKEKLAYDSWGKRRTLDGGATPDELDGVTDNRGYTGHEMLEKLELVHMNGRVYDPLVARFMSADPIIQDPEHSQSYNRYTYVWNNPTNLTDPTGFVGMELEDKRERQLREDQERRSRNSYQNGLDGDSSKTTASNDSSTSKGASGKPANNGIQIKVLTHDEIVQSVVAGVGNAIFHSFIHTANFLTAIGDVTGSIEPLPMWNPFTPKSNYFGQRGADTADGIMLVTAASGIGKGAAGLAEGALSHLTKSDFPSVAEKISQKQWRHVAGRKEYRGGGTLDSFQDSQSVLTAYHSGSAQIIGKSPAGFPVVRYDGVTGSNVNLPHFPNQPTNVFMIKGTSAPSVVPMNPNWTPR